MLSVFVLYTSVNGKIGGQCHWMVNVMVVVVVILVSGIYNNARVAGRLCCNNRGRGD